MRAIYKAVMMFFIKLCALILNIVAMAVFLLVYVFFGVVVFYYVFVGLVALAVYLCIVLLRDYRKIVCFDWFQPGMEMAEIELRPNSDLVYRVCKRYHDGATYNQIKREFDFNSDMQVVRMIKKGLEILLKEHSKA